MNSDLASANSGACQSRPASRRKPRRAPLDEAAVWQPWPDGWRRLFGSLDETGVSLEEHVVELSADFEWSRSFHPDTLELCLNLAGNGSVRHGDKVLEFEPLTAGFYLPGKSALQAWRRPGQHRFMTVEFSTRFLRAHLASSDGALHPQVEMFLQGGRSRPGLGEFCRLTAEQEHCIAQLQHPPVFQAARRLWYQSKVLQLMVDFFFERPGADELFCDRQKRVARERVDKAIAVLRADLAEPPDLVELGRKVGCSPFHLSRTFSSVVGLTIPQYLRKLRMERAAELLQSGKFNVTEAALEVGYSSLSHFSQAFCQTMGCCPALYPFQTTTQKAPAGLPPSNQADS